MDLLEKTLNPNKRLKEEFVSNLTGTSIAELTALSTIVPALVVLRQWSSFSPVNAKLYKGDVAAKKDGSAILSPKNLRSYVGALSLDFFCVILPILLIFTVLSEWVYECSILLVLLVLFRIITKRSSNLHIKEGSQHQSVRTAILSYRVLVVVVTCLCILAVDFNIFPRRYAKTETYGTGLMDLGVGSFVVANSLVSRQARNSLTMNWKATLQSVSPLVILGFGRLFSTTAVDYQVHVAEYGVHWNFFFTLAAVFTLTSLINIHPKYCGVLGSLILIGYQISLLCGLGEYLISNERTADIISQNKEGLFSIFGYWGMYLIGVQLGYQIFFGNNLSKMTGSVQRARFAVWILTVLFGFLTIILDKYVERISRRTCNLAYVMHVFAQNFQILSVLMLSDFISAQKPLVLEDAFNQNLLGSFLLANVLTGLVNLCVDTLSASPFVAFSILFGYSFMLSVFVGLACYYGIRPKFW